MKCRLLHRPLWTSLSGIALAVLLLFAIPSLQGCASQGMEPDNSAQTRQENPDERRTSALISLSTGHHKRADIALRENRRGDAIEEIQQLLVATEKHTVSTPEGHDVRFDAAARLARMHMEDKNFSDAEQVARRGLKREDQAPATLFRGHLHQVLADSLEAQGKLKEAVDEHGQAIEVFTKILDASPTAAPKE